MTEKKPVDWERVELDYRTGLLTLREIGELHGVSHVAIGKRAKKYGWVRDLSAKVRAKAEDLVTKRLVTKTVTKETLVTEARQIEIGAQLLADVKLAHHSYIDRAGKLTIALIGELEAQTGDIELFQQLGEMLRSPDDKGIDKLNDLYVKVISNPSRVDSAKKIVETLKTYVALQRQAYGIGELEKPDTPDAFSIVAAAEDLRSRIRSSQ